MAKFIVFDPSKEQKKKCKKCKKVFSSKNTNLDLEFQGGDLCLKCYLEEAKIYG